MAAAHDWRPAPPGIRVEVSENGARRRRGWERCELNENVRFSTAGLESYFFANWEPVVYDAMLVCAAAEFCDRTRRRPATGWLRDLELRVPVHEPERWNSATVSATLHDALQFLTGDNWSITFYPRYAAAAPPRQGLIDLGTPASAVMPYSDGLDSRAVAALMERELGRAFVRVRLGAKRDDGDALTRERRPFTSVPFKVKSPQRNGEPTARTRGFKFALVSGLAAYLAKANRVVVPESGQGALGPSLVTVGQAYPDYRSHPLFAKRMEHFLEALLGHEIAFEFPQLWKTKAETLEQFVAACEGASWADTRSCWQQARQVSVDGELRQCGVCASCMLRRASVHAAGLVEADETYVWQDLTAEIFEDGATAGFDRRRITGAMREYAIAGAQYLDHLAAIHHSPANEPMLDLAAFQLGRALELSETEAGAQLERLLNQHEKEWRGFVDSLGPTSFLRDWVVQAYEQA